VVAVCLMAIVAGCDERPHYIPDPDYLSQDAHLKIAGTQIVLPIVAVADVSGSHPYHFNWERLTADQKQRFRQATANPAQPLVADSVGLSIAPYGTHGESSLSLAICPRLTRRWSRQLCDYRSSGVLRDLPDRFALAERRVLPSIRVGNERESGRLASLNLAVGQPAFLCDHDDKFCRAVVLISPQLVAVWPVWNSTGPPKETAEQMTQRQGRAILTFVEDAIGEQERIDRIAPIDKPRL
jgi:hypothetical protein